jgi:hypothetical protein
MVKDEVDDLVADFHSFPQLLNVHVVNDIRRADLHTTKTLVPEPCPFEVEVAIEDLKSYKSPGIVQITVE